MKNESVEFQDRKIRRIWFNDEWWFVATDIILVLTDSKNPSGYLKDMRRRDESFAKGWGQIATLLYVETQGGKQKLNCVSVKGAFRLIQSVPSLKAEPFKQWLAQIGKERLDEIRNPELLHKRAEKYYELKNYPKEWINKRIKGISTRNELTDEWKKRGITDDKHFAILTDELYKSIFEVSTNEYKRIKGIDKENLRDFMSEWELIFSMLGEKASAEIARAKDVKGLEGNKTAVKKGGRIASNAKKELEKETGKEVISNALNHLDRIYETHKKKHPNKNMSGDELDKILGKK